MTSALSTSEILSHDIAEACTGGSIYSASSDLPTRLSGAAPQPRGHVPGRVVRCYQCGSDAIEETVWVSVNSGEVTESEGPTNQTWCPTCDDDQCERIEDLGHGFELWREGEFSGWFATLPEARTEGEEGSEPRPYEILPCTGSDESAPL